MHCSPGAHGSPLQGETTHSPEKSCQKGHHSSRFSHVITGGHPEAKAHSPVARSRKLWITVPPGHTLGGHSGQHTALHPPQ
eukprot:1967076-Rhodomonas_salina.1